MRSIYKRAARFPFKCLATASKAIATTGITTTIGVRLRTSPGFKNIPNTAIHGFKNLHVSKVKSFSKAVTFALAFSAKYQNVNKPGRSWKFSPDCSGILFMKRSGIKRYSGKRAAHWKVPQMFRF